MACDDPLPTLDGQPSPPALFSFLLFPSRRPEEAHPPSSTIRFTASRSGERSSSPSGSGRSPAAKRIFVHFSSKFSRLVRSVTASSTGRPVGKARRKATFKSSFYFLERTKLLASLWPTHWRGHVPLFLMNWCPCLKMPSTVFRPTFRRKEVLSVLCRSGRVLSKTERLKITSNYGSKLLALLPNVQMSFEIPFRTIYCRNSGVLAMLNKHDSYSDLNFRRHQKLNYRHLRIFSSYVHKFIQC